MKPKKYSMGRVRMRFLVEGNVQGVGYRALVKQIARQLKVAGSVKNLDDGTVEIFCECEQRSIERFKEKISIRGNSDDPLSLNVEMISESEIERLPKESKSFSIDYGEEAGSEFEKSSLERLEIGSLILTRFRDSTADRFDSIENKYGVIHKQMVRVEQALVESLGTLTQQIIKSNNGNAELINVLISKLDK